jgi:gas vesicle protein
MGQGTEERLSSEIAGTRADLGRNVDELVDKVAPSKMVERRKQAARSRLRRMKDSIMGTAHSGTDTMSDAGSAVADRASSVADSMSSTAQDAAQQVRSRAEGSPLAAGLIAFGVGALVGALLPASEKEAQAARRVVETAQEQGQPLIEQAKSAGQEVGQHLKEQAGQAAQEVRSTAQDSAQHVKEEGQDAAHTVQDDAQSRMS